MKLLLTASSQQARLTRHRQKLEAVGYLLDKSEIVGERRFLKKLADYLLFADNPLIAFPAPLLAEIIVQILEFLKETKDVISIRTTSLSNRSGRLLMIGAPNVPYVVESLLGFQGVRDFSFQLLAHPVLAIRRQGGTITYLGDDVRQGDKQLFILLKQENLHGEDGKSLEAEVRRVLTAVLQAGEDQPRMLERFDSLKEQNRFKDHGAFIDWLKKDAFIPFAYRRIVTNESGGFTGTCLPASEAALGMDIDACYDVDRKASAEAFLEDLKTILGRNSDVIVQAVTLHSIVLYEEPLIYIGFREPTGKGRCLEHMFLGLFRKTELNGVAGKVPALQRKIIKTLASTRLSSGSHDYQKLKELCDLFPKVELFFLGDAQLYIVIQSLIRYLYRPDTVKLLVLASASPFRISSLIIIPKLLFREGIDDVLQQALCRELECSLEIAGKISPGGDFIGLQLILSPKKETNEIDVYALERALNRLARPWHLTLRHLLERAFGKDDGSMLWQKYHEVFPLDYQTLMPPRYAAKDIVQIERILRERCQNINLLNPCQNIEHYRLHFYSERERFLDEYIPVLENLNLRLIDQVQFSLCVNGQKIYIKSFAIGVAAASSKTLSSLKPLVLDCIQAILDEKSANDTLNSLLVLAGMSWKEIDLLRAYRNYYLQLGYRTTMVSFHQALIDNPKVSRLLFDYFEARFRPVPEWDDPGIREERMLFPLRLQLLESIENVSGINDDRILRTLFNLIDATVRSNFHVRKEVDEYFVAFKINSLGVIEMPSPKPVFEIYVHAFDMEGIHLRGGKVSRGGIRWSDRPDDFRTEILGLMQTQMSKNALIIPKGAKGGFVVKHPRAGESLKESGKRAYVTLIRGLLDLTDNYVGAGVVGPPGIVSYDDEDPYLVVAADKGTAQFPDIANAVAEEYRYWLRDAFASGGSRGYSHKALGITARGAWECVKRHFRELGKDIQTQPFTVVGIGSMDGDVFGNGMLLSEQIRLRAAISGQHIFIDPSPREDGAPFVERRRLFELPGSSWDDYDRKLISEGGGVFHRDSKNIPVSSAIKNWLGIRYRSIDGETLIRYLLTAEVELLWLGGIGTYVKSGAEKHEEVGDRANDSVRVDAGQLKAAIVGEGANLGFTQKARVEFNLAGGKINTDAVDNSAGVDTSDHEVNIKILLNDLQKRGVVDDYQTLFEGISGEVCSDVLANNYAQSLCLSLDYLRCRGNPQRFMELADHLESAGLLDRAVESFPRPKQVMSRPEQRLTRPELAVLMSAAKIQLTQLLLDENDFVSADFCDLYLYSYFPEAIKEGFGAFLSSHPLAKDIKATYISNKIVNQAGCLFLNPIGETEAGEIIEGVAAYLTFDRALSGYSMRQALFGLDNQFDAEVQYGLLMQFEEVLSSICSWSLLHGDKIRPDEETLSYWLKSLEEYERYFNHHCCGEDNTAYQEKFAGLRDKGIPDEIARRLAFVFGLENFPLIVKLTVETGRSLERVLALFNELLEYLNLNIIGAQLAQLAIHDQWERKVLFDLKEDMKLAAGKLVGKIFDSGFENCAGFFEAVERRRKTSQYQRLCKQLCVSPPAALLPYVSIVRELERLLER